MQKAKEGYDKIDSRGKGNYSGIDMGVLASNVVFFPYMGVVSSEIM
jgi:hypothetical protein